MKFDTFLRGTECHLYVCFTHQSTSLLLPLSFLVFVQMFMSQLLKMHVHTCIWMCTRICHHQNIQWCPHNKKMLYHFYEIVGHFKFQNADAFVSAVTYQPRHLTVLKTWPPTDALMLRQITPHGSLQRLRIRHLKAGKKKSSIQFLVGKEFENFWSLFEPV